MAVFDGSSKASSAGSLFEAGHFGVERWEGGGRVVTGEAG
jgi:hypothetical protein